MIISEMRMRMIMNECFIQERSYNTERFHSHKC